MQKRIICILISAVLLFISQAQAEQKTMNDMSIKELTAQATTMHPAGFYVLATKLFRKDKMEDAVFWYYVGQIRYRFHLAANPNLEKSGDPALYSSLQNIVGTPINQYAGGDPDFWAASVKKARKWDGKNPNSFTSKEKYQKEYNEVLSGMDKMISYIEKNKKQIREQRKRNGLTNR